MTFKILSGVAVALLALPLVSCGTESLTPTADGAAAPDVGVDASLDAAPPAPVDHPTYWANVAPILQSRCVQCHTAGGLGPFPLVAYEDARSRAALLSQTTMSRRMPPWPPAAACRPMEHARVLTDAEITTIQRWSLAGAPEGERAQYVAPTNAPTPLPEHPSVTVQPSMPYVPPAQRLDDYHCFVMDPGLTASRDLIAARFVPGEPRTVHHVIVYEVKAAALAALDAIDAAEPGPGYTCFGGPSIPGHEGDTQFISGWAPGSPPVRFPENTGVRLSAGSRLVMQVHYNQTNGHDLPDQTHADLYFSDAPVSSVAFVVPMTQHNLNITAGDRDVVATNDITLRRLGVPISATVHGVFPHMHTLGTHISVSVDRAGGAGTDCMVDIPQWNFHWQQFYFFNEPMRIGPDDTVRLRCEYDNSPANQPVVDGVPRTPRDVHWGEGTSDEMCLNFFYITVP